MSKRLDELIEEAGKLSMVEKQVLANHLLEEVKQVEDLFKQKNSIAITTKEGEVQRRKQHIQWVKDHQAEYAGKYVALNGYCLVAEGDSYPEVYEAVRKIGIEKPFITQVFAPDSVVFGGW